MLINNTERYTHANNTLMLTANTVEPLRKCVAKMIIQNLFLVIIVFSLFYPLLTLVHSLSWWKGGNPEADALLRSYPISLY